MTSKLVDDLERLDAETRALVWELLDTAARWPQHRATSLRVARDLVADELAGRPWLLRGGDR